MVLLTLLCYKIAARNGFKKNENQGNGSSGEVGSTSMDFVVIKPMWRHLYANTINRLKSQWIWHVPCHPSTKEKLGTAFAM